MTPGKLLALLAPAADLGVVPWAALITAVSSLITTIIWVTYKLHRDAVRAHDKRADDWKTACEREQQRNDEQTRQILAIVDTVKTLGKPS